MQVYITLKEGWELGLKKERKESIFFGSFLGIKLIITVAKYIEGGKNTNP